METNLKKSLCRMKKVQLSTERSTAGHILINYYTLYNNSSCFHQQDRCNIDNSCTQNNPAEILNKPIQIDTTELDKNMKWPWPKTINVREYRFGSQKKTIQRNWQIRHTRRTKNPQTYHYMCWTPL